MQVRGCIRVSIRLGRTQERQGDGVRLATIVGNVMLMGLVGCATEPPPEEGPPWGGLDAGDSAPSSGPDSGDDDDDDDDDVDDDDDDGPDDDDDDAVDTGDELPDDDTDPDDDDDDDDAGSTGGEEPPPNQECATIDMPLDVLIGTDADYVQAALPLMPGVEYRFIEIALDFTVGDWNGTCYNPAAGSNPDQFPVWQELLALKRGNHWCKGGNAFSVTTQGGDFGHLISKSYYKEEIWNGSGCGETDIEADIIDASHAFAVDVPTSTTITYDRVAGTLTVDMDGQVETGPLHPDVHVVGSVEHDWNAVASFDGGYLGCYGPPGDDRCCHIPSLDWTFAHLAITACPDPP